MKWVSRVKFERAEGAFEAAIGYVSVGPCEEADCLHPAEAVYYAGLKADKRKESYLLGRQSAKLAVSELRGITDHRTICIDAGVFGFPVVRCVQAPNVQVSISHCDEAAVAVAFPEHHPVGIDIEIVKAENMDTLESALVASDREVLQKEGLATVFGYTAIWAAKEALSKILKTGLTLDFEMLKVQSVEREGDMLVFRYNYFMQYKAVVYRYGKFVVCLAFPGRSIMGGFKI
ncbi:4'-phosphopantetheinyl transferase superfamily protein [Chitinophaga sp.]|uniref:4'-phosphopantetheinyl transferase family protein n=1 Tax=Chitinophaga sp. TaxID=1869181 RepID=UPI0031D9C293